MPSSEHLDSRPSTKGYQPAPGFNPESSRKRPGQKGSKACCFCWCCCCSCSCLTVKNNEHSKSPQCPIPEPVDEMPSAEEIKSWGLSFDRLMKSKSGQKVFADFLKSEFSDENILFWQACEDLKKETSPEKVQEKARLIYEDFVSILSPKEVSLDSRVREIINNNMLHPTQYTFDEAQNQVYVLMHRDSYPRFMNSRIYQKLEAEAESQTLANG